MTGGGLTDWLSVPGVQLGGETVVYICAELLAARGSNYIAVF